MSPKAKAHTVRLSTFLSEEQHNAIKISADKKGLTVSALIRLLVMEHLEKERK